MVTVMTMVTVLTVMVIGTRVDLADSFAVWLGA